jgi:hypothetical protein
MSSSIKILVTPEDARTRRVEELLAVRDMSADQRRAKLVELERRTFTGIASDVLTAAGVTHHVGDVEEILNEGGCKWCPVRERLLARADYLRRLAAFASQLVHPAARMVLGTPCPRCCQFPLRIFDRRVHKDQRTASRSTGRPPALSARSASGLPVRSRHGPSTHDPFGTCVLCKVIDGHRPKRNAMTASIAPNDTFHHAPIFTLAECHEYLAAYSAYVPIWLWQGLREYAHQRPQ